MKESHIPYEVNEPFQTGEGRRDPKEEDRKRHRKSHDKRGWK